MKCNPFPIPNYFILSHRRKEEKTIFPYLNLTNIKTKSLRLLFFCDFGEITMVPSVETKSLRLLCFCDFGEITMVPSVETKSLRLLCFCDFGNPFPIPNYFILSHRRKEEKTIFPYLNLPNVKTKSLRLLCFCDFGEITMVPSVDFAVSSLLCAEDDTSIFEDVEIGGRNNQRSYWTDCGFNFGGGFSSSRLFVLPVQGEDCLDVIFKREIQHLPCEHYLERLISGEEDLGARNQAVDWISKVQSYYDFGPLCAYLSINYLDQFLSAYELPVQSYYDFGPLCAYLSIKYLDRFLFAYELPKGKAWMVQLLAVACLSLAAKMQETEVPLSLDFQTEEAKFVFEAKTIQTMELAVLSTLKWRMQSVTPFSFLDYFLSKICFDQQISPTSLYSQAFQLIISTAQGIEFLEFRPSEIAAAVAISVAGPNSTEDTEKAISLLSEHIEKGRLGKCFNKVQDLASIVGVSGSAKTTGGGVGGSSPSIPQSPIGVLDASTSLSYKSDDTADTKPIGSCANSTQNSPASNSKRRKLNLEIEW